MTKPVTAAHSKPGENADSKTDRGAKSPSRMPCDEELTQVIEDQRARIAELEEELFHHKETCREAKRDLRLTRFAFERGGDAMLWLGKNGAVLYADPTARGWLQLELTELPSSNIFEIDLLMSPEHWPAHWRKLQDQSSFSFESRYQGSDGREFPVEIQANYQETDGQEYNVVIFRDITEKRQQEIERKHRATIQQYSQQFVTPFNDESEIKSSLASLFEELAGLLDLSRLWLAQLELGAWPLGNLEWSRNAKSIFRSALSSNSERLWWNAQFSTETTAVAGTRVDRDLPSGLAKSLSEGSVQSFLAAPIRVLGSLWGYVAFADTRSRAWTEQERQLIEHFAASVSRAVERSEGKRKLEESADRLETALSHAEKASSAKSEFLANMSHEFRTPMTAIVGYAQLLSRKSPNQHDQRLWAKQLRQNADYLLSLVNDILDLSKIEAGELKPVMECCSTRSLLDEVVALMAPQAAEKMLFLDVHAKTRIPAAICTDDLRMRQILVNLISNAVKYTDDGGVSVELEYLPRRTATGDLVITVTDTGCGISGELMSRLFEPFTQATQTRAKGTGLGLSIARRLAQMLHGDISAESTPGNGSRFQFRVVIKPDGDDTIPEGPVRFDSEAQSEEHESTPNLEGIRILIADDSPENITIFRYFLEEAGAYVSAASNGAEAVRLALGARDEKKAYDLILMDMLMPVLNGYESTRRLRTSGVSTPIVALTAYATARDRDKCLTAGCDDFITKPVLPRTFLRRVAAHTHRGHGDTTEIVRSERKTSTNTPTLAAVFCPDALKTDPGYLALVDQYLSHLPAMMEEIRRAQETDDRRTLRLLAHRLKGNAASYGFPALSEAANRLDSSLERDPNPAELSALIETLFVEMPNMEQR